MVHKILNSYKSIIFLNGDFPNKKLFDFIDLNVTIIAADGASDKLKNYSINPNFNIGDGDSIGEKKSNSFIKILDQNKTDFEKAIIFAKKLNLLPSLVLGFGGGEIDHIIGNAQIMTKYSDKKELFFLDTYPTINGFGTKLGVVLNNEFNIKLNIGSTITIIPFKESLITTQGLKWDLKEKRINSNFFSLRNYNISKIVTFKLKKGRALIILDITKNISSLKKQLKRILFNI
ncbi:MAG: hypothetical protein KR126chlam4_00858 [Candidatus Anoxychlamydiales bacterium]|uniref:Thiamin pyrophosphokinase catalytic domain-containing protein n=1 Tax=marine sediment metagenome TaxID=412755 RepID=A0A0F9KA91_9ZZZZ|nr:hypothetical protein [Candidatus Anoxychlamydiales bacterium]HEU64563.1 thiamine diphosphokinase [Chlamydiota bacterium]